MLKQRWRPSIVPRTAECRAATLDLTVDPQLGGHVLQAAADAVDAALGRDPQFDVLAVGFGGEVETAIAQLLFHIRYRQRWLALETHGGGVQSHAHGLLCERFGGILYGLGIDPQSLRPRQAGRKRKDEIEAFRAEQRALREVGNG